MTASVEVFCDFDGTITNGDTIDVLLERLAKPSWRDIEARWEAGEIGSRECMALQVPLLQGGWEAVLKVLDSVVTIDPSFPAFAQWCRKNGVPLRIVSDGLDRVIHHILKKHNIHVDNVFANHLMDAEDGSLQLSFPHAPRYAMCSSGLCKCQVLENAPAKPLKVVIGDGRSDFCWSADADMVFAKDKLFKYCKSNKIASVPFNDFSVVRYSLEQILVPTPSLPAFASKSQLYPGFIQAM